MTEIDDIREAYAKGKTISTIAKEYGKDRKTVRKYIQQEDFNVARPAVKETTKHHKLDPYNLHSRQIIPMKGDSRRDNHTDATASL